MYTNNPRFFGSIASPFFRFWQKSRKFETVTWILFPTTKRHFCLLWLDFQFSTFIIGPWNLGLWCRPGWNILFHLFFFSLIIHIYVISSKIQNGFEKNKGWKVGFRRDPYLFASFLDSQKNKPLTVSYPRWHLLQDRLNLFFSLKNIFSP